MTAYSGLNLLVLNDAWEFIACISYTYHEPPLFVLEMGPIPLFTIQIFKILSRTITTLDLLLEEPLPGTPSFPRDSYLSKGRSILCFTRRIHISYFRETDPYLSCFDEP